MDFFSQTYNALRGPTGAPQSPLETIQRLAGRLSPSTLLADRRAAVLSLKGLSRDWRAEVGENALPGLLQVLENDAEIDSEIAKAVLETLHLLCDVGDASPTAESKALALKYSDEVLKTETPTQKLFVLLGDQNFYVKYASLQLLATLLHNRRQLVQSYFLKAQDAPANMLGALENRREIIRNEGLLLIQSLTSQSPDIQKLLAFEGAFDKLFGLIQKEGGIDGGQTVRDCLTCVDGLLRLNISNQTFFRETGLVGFLTSQLLFPLNLPPQEPAPQEFALQFWDQQKTSNVRLVVGILGLLVGSKGTNEAESNVLLRCLIEFALASNSPTIVKTQALQLLPPNLNFPLISHMVTPFLPVPDTNDEEWDRLEPIVALDALIDLVVLGEYGGADSAMTRHKAKETLLLRTAGASVFENYTRKEELRLMILQAMLPNEDPNAARPTLSLLHSLAAPPATPLNPASVLSTQLSTFLFSSLIRSSSRCKQLARQLKPTASSAPSGQQFFVPADGPPSDAQDPAAQEAVTEDEPQTIIALLAEHLSLAFLSRVHAATAETESDAREWDRLIVVYLALFSQWLWEDPKAVREFLESGGLGMLVEPINQTSNVDPLVQGLCAFLLGVCYEFNREPGEITRSTIHSIITRLSADALNGRMVRVREDERFRAISPEEIILPYRFPALHSAPGRPDGQEDPEVEIWFDWSFVDFWKSNYYTIQRAVSLDPNTLSSTSGESAESAMLIASLREVIRNQAAQIEELQSQLKSAQSAKQTEQQSQDVQKQISLATATSAAEISELESQIESLRSELEATRLKSADAEKEQEDLLVLLDELSAKRRRDKDAMRKAELDVSEDEGDDEGGDGE